MSDTDAIKARNSAKGNRSTMVCKKGCTGILLLETYA